MTAQSHRAPLPLWAILTMVLMAFALGIMSTLLLGRDPATGEAASAVEPRHDVVPVGVEGTSGGSVPGVSRPAAILSGTPRPSPRTSREEQATLFSGFEARFREDARMDTAWAQPAERSLVEAATEEALVEHGVPVEFQARCMSRMCKVQMAFDSAGAAHDWSELYVLGMADAVTSVRSVLVPRGDGKTELILYGTRKGSESMLSTAGQPSRNSPLATPRGS